MDGPIQPSKHQLSRSRVIARGSGIRDIERLRRARDFSIVDASRPRVWTHALGEEGEEYSYPPKLARPGFFEDYFDGRRAVMATLHEYLSELGRNRRHPA